jgi:hypothetical protein
MEEAARTEHTHLDPSEIYRLGEADLQFAELLPEPPGGLDQDEFEERRRRDLELGPYVRRICDSPEIIEVINPDWKPTGDKKAD